MARETKAERLAREEAENVLRLETLKAAYPERLMAALERAYVNNYEVVPKNNEFRLVDRDDMIAYISAHDGRTLHQDYLDDLNTFSQFVLKPIPLDTIWTELPMLDRAKVEKYKQMDFSKAPPIVIGDGYILDGYHRATVAKALGMKSINAYVGVKGVTENFADGNNLLCFC